MSHADRLLTFVKQARHQQSTEALGARLIQLCEPLGVKRYACLYLKADAGGYTISRVISNVPPDWRRIYLARGYEASDAIFQGAIRSGAFGFWSEMTRTIRLSRGAIEVINFASQIDMLEGFTRRVMLDGAGIALMMVSGREMQTSEDTRAVLRIACDVFANEGARLIGASADLDLSEAFQPLSPKELEVLQLRADGLTNKAVAAQLDRNQKTIETHVSHILNKLDARTMNEAVRIASRRNLLR